jgi:isocitrate/isopropylmalate dehydrogenase
MKIAVIAGDGIGPEVVAQSLHVLDALCPFDFDFSIEAALAGASACEQCGHSLLELTVRVAMQSDAVIRTNTYNSRRQAWLAHNPFRRASSRPQTLPARDTSIASATEATSRHVWTDCPRRGRSGS